jgi:hypothetical protein
MNRPFANGLRRFVLFSTNTRGGALRRPRRWRLGAGGIAAVARATGIALSTIGRALREVRSGEALDAGRVRRPGGGGKLKSETDPSLIDDLRALIERDTRGDPQSALLWTCKSLSKLASALCDMGHQIGRSLVGELLHKLGYRLQANRKMREGGE